MVLTEAVYPVPVLHPARAAAAAALICPQLAAQVAQVAQAVAGAAVQAAPADRVLMAAAAAQSQGAAGTLPAAAQTAAAPQVTRVSKGCTCRAQQIIDARRGRGAVTAPAAPGGGGFSADTRAEGFVIE
jgi:hypothetical protein